MFSYMSLLQMSFSGAMVILVIVVLRALLINRLPKKVFLGLWTIALLRLLIPLTVSSPFSIYTLAQRNEGVKNVVMDTPAEEIVPFVSVGEQGKIEDGLKESTQSSIMKDEIAHSERRNAAEEVDGKEGYAKRNISDKGLKYNLDLILPAAYITGVIISGSFFVISYIKCYREFNTSMPVDHSAAQNWINTHFLKRKISIRQTGFIHTPLTYGIISPVILMPSTTNWEEEQLQYILAHEFIHIKRFDAVTKMILTGALCMHWFNPAVWVMYNLLNRDLEISCDEEVIRQFGETNKAFYARTLIGMEERKSGLVSLYNYFGINAISKNAIEERIMAIMKIKKTSAAAVFVGVLLILATVVAFTTSAKAVSEKDYLKRLPFEELSDEDSEKLLALWFDGYEAMTVKDFQEKAWKLTDTPEYMDLIEDFSKSEYVFEMEEGKEADALNEFLDYFHNIFEPLTAERWQTREFSGFVTTNLQPEGHAQVSWEYVMSLTILEPDKLTVKEYRDARLSAQEDMKTFLQGRTEEELSDSVYLLKAVREEVKRIENQRSSEKVTVSIAYTIFPLEEGMEEVVAQVREMWDETLAPYLAFGLTYQYVPTEGNWENGLKMYWQGMEVRGIVDEERGMWISEHAGNTTYSEDAVELYVVYDKGRQTGLRPATEEEQAEWDMLRNQNSLSLIEKRIEEDREERDFPNGTREDYDSLYDFVPSNYKELSVAELNAYILAWCNEDYDRMERIGTDSAQDDYAVALKEEEKDFAAFTLWFSRVENYRMIQNEYAVSSGTGSKKDEEDPGYSGKRMNKQSKDGLVWCTLDYQFTYHIADKDKLKVGERDASLVGMINSIQEFWEETSLETLVLLDEEDIVGQLQFFAQKYSSDLLTIQVDENMVHYECMDEREFA